MNTIVETNRDTAVVMAVAIDDHAGLERGVANPFVPVANVGNDRVVQIEPVVGTIVRQCGLSVGPLLESQKDPDLAISHLLALEYSRLLRDEPIDDVLRKAFAPPFGDETRCVEATFGLVTLECGVPKDATVGSDVVVETARATTGVLTPSADVERCCPMLAADRGCIERLGVVAPTVALESNLRELRVLIVLSEQQEVGDGLTLEESNLRLEILDSARHPTSLATPVANHLANRDLAEVQQICTRVCCQIPVFRNQSRHFDRSRPVSHDMRLSLGQPYAEHTHAVCWAQFLTFLSPFG